MLKTPHSGNLKRRMLARITCLGHLHECSGETQVRADAEVEPYFCAYACVAEEFDSVGRSTPCRPASSCESMSVYGQADVRFCAVAMPKKEKR